MIFYQIAKDLLFLGLISFLGGGFLVIYQRYFSLNKEVKKKQVLICLAAGVFLLAIAYGNFIYHQKIVFDGFRSMKFGTHISNYPNLIMTNEGGNGWSGIIEREYVDRNDKKNPVKFGDFYKTDKIWYYFKEDRFYKAILWVPYKDKVFIKDSDFHNKGYDDKLKMEWGNANSDVIVGGEHHWINQERKIIAEILTQKYGKPDVEIRKPGLDYEVLHWKGYQIEIELKIMRLSNREIGILITYSSPQLISEYETKEAKIYKKIDNERKEKREKEKDEFNQKLKGN